MADGRHRAGADAAPPSAANGMPRAMDRRQRQRLGGARRSTTTPRWGFVLGREVREDPGGPDDAEEDSAGLPEVVAYHPSLLPRHALLGGFALSSTGSVVAIFLLVEDGTSGEILAAGTILALALLTMWALLSWSPTFVTIRGHVLEVARGSVEHRVDLRVPECPVTIGPDPDSPLWKTVVRRESARSLVIRALHVEPRGFVEHVRHLTG